MRCCPYCGKGKLRENQHEFDPNVIWYSCNACKQEMILPEFMMGDDVMNGWGIVASEDIGIAGPFPGLYAFQDNLITEYANEVKDLGGQSIFHSKTIEAMRNEGAVSV